MIDDVQEIDESSFAHTLKKTISRFRKTKRSKLRDSLDNSTSIQLTQVVKQCRICLDSEETPQNQMVNPCKCIGSVKYVHDKCYRQWIEKQYSQKAQKQRQRLLNSGIECQLCKVKIGLSFNFKHTCCKTSKFKDKLNSSTLVFVLFLIFFIVDLTSIGYLSYYTAIHPLNYRQQTLTALITIVALMFLSACFLIVFYYFARDYFLETIWVLQSYFLKKAQSQRYSRHQIVPEQADQ